MEKTRERNGGVPQDSLILFQERCARIAGAVLPTIVGRHRRHRNEAAGESKRERGRKVLIFGRNSKIGAEETSTSRSRQILRDPERFKEVRGIPLFFPLQRDVVFLLRVPARGSLSIARFQRILYKGNQKERQKGRRRHLSNKIEK